MSIIYRESYIEKVEPFINKNLIKVFIGQRRVGKSYIMRMVGEYIQTQVTDFQNKEIVDIYCTSYKISVGVLKGLEIDFVAIKGNETVYVQVAYIITDNKVKEREFGNLVLIKDNYPKYVVSLDPVTIASFKGIKHLHLRDFLKTENL